MDSWAHQQLRGRGWRLSMSIKVPGEPGEDAVRRTKWNQSGSWQETGGT